MVNELAKIVSSTTPGEIKTKIARDRKRSFSEVARPKAPPQTTLGEAHKKPRQTPAPNLTAKQIIDLVPRLTNEEVSKLVGSLLKRRKFKKDQAAPSTSKTPGPVLPMRSGRMPPQPAQPVHYAAGTRTRELTGRKERDLARMRRKERHQSTTPTEENLLQEKHAGPLSAEPHDEPEIDLAHDLLSQALRYIYH